MKISKAHATWKGKLKDGKGKADIPSIGKNVQYSFSSRFETGQGTNPEELLATAHAQCFSMAFAQVLEENGYDPKSITTTAEVTLDKENGDFGITRSALHAEVEVQDIEEEELRKLAEVAKDGCPVSRALSVSDISVAAELV